MIVKTEAIVLKKLNFRDTSRIVTLLSKEYGRLSVLAKGARDPKSKFGPVLDTFNHLQVVLYKKEGRDLHLLSQCDLLSRFDGLTRDLNRVAHALSVLDMVNAVSEYGEERTPLFEPLLETLRGIHKGGDLSGMILFFQTRLLCLLGFQPDLTRCAACRTVIEGVSGTNNGVFRLTGDGILCRRCGSGTMHWMEAGSDTIDLLRTCQHLAEVSGPFGNFSTETRREAQVVLTRFLGNHVEGIRNLKAGPVLASILDQG